MADEFNTGTNWWDNSSTRNSTNNRFDTTAAGSSSSSGLNNNSFGWANETTRSSMDSVTSVSGNDLHMMGLGLSSHHPIDWNQPLLRGDKGEESFRSMLQDNMGSNTNYQQESGMWRSSEKMFPGMGRGFCVDQSQFSPHGGNSSDSTVTRQSVFQMDSTAIYGSPSNILQGILGSDQTAQSQQSYTQYGNQNYGEILPNSWSKIPQFLRSSPPKQQQQQIHGQLHFSNNAPFWNPSATASDVRPAGFLPSLQTQIPIETKNMVEVGDSTTVVKKSGNEPASKRPRNENPSTLPAFKVRKEKMGDRITALQQLVSPFGKTDTASVLSEAIEYIKFLHDQIGVLSTPYMKSGAPIQHQQNSEKPKDPEGPKQDLRTRGLCLVPVSSTFPVTHESPVDFWTPTFGGTFR